MLPQDGDVGANLAVNVGTNDGPAAAVGHARGRQDLQPHGLPDAAGRRVKDVLGLGPPVLRPARLREVVGRVAHADRQPVAADAKPDGVGEVDVEGDVATLVGADGRAVEPQRGLVVDGAEAQDEPVAGAALGMRAQVVEAGLVPEHFVGGAVVLGRLDLGEGQVADHLERQRLRARLALAPHALQRRRVPLLGAEVLVVGDAHRRQLRRRRRGAGGRLDEGRRVREGVVEDDGVADADVLERPPRGVDEGGVDAVERVEPLDHAPEHGGLAVEEVEVGAERDDELRRRDAELLAVRGRRAARRGGRGHAHRPALRVLQLRVELGRERLARGALEQAPDGGAAVAAGVAGPDGVARLEGEALLHIVHGRVVVSI